MRPTRLTILLLTAVVLNACSKSPAEHVVDAANVIGRQIMEPLAPKDASGQAERMITLVVADKAECGVFRARMREAGKGSPFDAVTQRQFVQVQQDACKANCCKP
jgi:hypothetical protein